MAVLLFPDNTVLVNFAIIRRMDLLERLSNGNGRWCATVADECHASARVPGLADIQRAATIFGVPLRPNAAEHQDLLVLRQELASPGDARHAHLGEAETLAIVLRRGLRGFFVTDDVGAQRLAAKNDVQVVPTWTLLRMAGRQGWVDDDTLWGYVQTLRDARRGSPPGVRDRGTFQAWLES